MKTMLYQLLYLDQLKLLPVLYSISLFRWNTVTLPELGLSKEEKKKKKGQAKINKEGIISVFLPV
jgi:hypothetical protein